MCFLLFISLSYSAYLLNCFVSGCLSRCKTRAEQRKIGFLCGGVGHAELFKVSAGTRY